MDKPQSSYKYRLIRELIKAKKIGTYIERTTNSRKVPYTNMYELRKEKQEKKVINEINRLNLNSDYGV